MSRLACGIFRSAAVLACALILFGCYMDTIPQPGREVPLLLDLHSRLRVSELLLFDRTGQYTRSAPLSGCEKGYCFEVTGSGAHYKITITPEFALFRSRRDRREFSLYSDQTGVVRVSRWPRANRNTPPLAKSLWAGALTIHP